MPKMIKLGKYFTRFEWRESTWHKGDPQQIGEYLDQLCEKFRVDDRKMLPVEEVLDEVRANPETSPLYGLLEHDDEVAAREWRKAQLRSIINSLETVVVEEGGYERRSPTYVNIVLPEADNRRVYVPLTAAARREQDRQQIIEAALIGLNAWTKRYNLFCESEEFAAAVERVQEVLESLRNSQPVEEPQELIEETM